VWHNSATMAIQVPEAATRRWSWILICVAVIVIEFTWIQTPKGNADWPIIVLVISTLFALYAVWYVARQSMIAKRKMTQALLATTATVLLFETVVAVVACINIYIARSPR
jgi:hypothetical protein